ncbi:MAG: site-specific integrase [Lachnospiraceae bacterium]|nr:site-specific integrase [Lachnospiraceae bacterium]
MSRKGENIYRRKDGRWEGRYIREYSLEGRAHFGYVYGKTYAETKEKLSECRARMLLPGPEKDRLSVSYETILLRWLYASRLNVKESSYARYYELVHTHLIPSMGKWKIDKIGTLMVEQYIAHLLTQGRTDGTGGLAPKTAADILSIIKNSMQFAAEQGYTTSCNLNKIYVKKDAPEIRVFTADEQNRLKAVLLADTDPVKMGILLCLYTGIRIGELCALRWKHLRPKQGILEIRYTLQRVKNTDMTEDHNQKTKIIITEPKSTFSVRDIPLTAFMAKTALPFEAPEEAFILTGKEDHYMEPRTVQNRFQACLKEAEIPHTNFHTCRHTFATRCVERGVDIKSLSEILGHANVNITLNRYVHSSFEWKRENMNKLEESADY